MLTKEGLRGFTGTENWYRHGLNRNILMTDGAMYVADEGGAHWLMDEIALANKFNPKVKAEEFQVWKLVKKADPRVGCIIAPKGALLLCEDGDDNLVYFKKIEFTDFPLPTVELWCESGGDHKVILLPTEH